MFEQIVRDASGNPNFAFPFWDWTSRAEMPPDMFAGALDPAGKDFDRYTSSFPTFKKYLGPAMTTYWDGLSQEQTDLLKNTRGLPSMDALWAQVEGNEKDGAMYVTTPHARFMTAKTPWLDKKTKGEVAASIVGVGLRRRTFASFNSVKTTSHNLPPSGPGVFSILEAHPHNKTHNYIGGVNYVGWKDYGWMADNLSPVDPVFFLHHSNMDRLWDVWSRKQRAAGLSDRPDKADWPVYAAEKFLFYIDPNGKPVPRNTAGDYFDIGDFDYSYAQGYGEEMVVHPPLALTVAANTISATASGGKAALNVPAGFSAPATADDAVVTLTLPHPTSGSAPREYDVLVNAPPGTGPVSADSPYYAGTISFFGFMDGMNMGDVTFQIPLSTLPAAARSGKLVFTIVPAAGTKSVTGGTTMLGMAPAASPLKSVTITTAQ
jgi:tyrosinase